MINKINLKKSAYFLLITVFTVLSFNVNNYAAEKLAKLPDFYIGKANAPITIYEFVSLGCPHCAKGFNDIIKDVKPKYIDTGKVKLVIMPFPIFGPNDIDALSILYFSKNNDQFLKLITLYFNNQSTWLMPSGGKKGKDIIIDYAKLAGFTDAQINKYNKDTKIAKDIEANAKIYFAKYNIEGTPTTIIVKTGSEITKKSDTFVGDADIKDIEKVLNKLMKK
ncbi:DsbA family protein [Rickettsiales bacterium LUAb2]